MESETIIIKGIAYKVIQSKTPDQYEADELPNLAKHMRARNVKRALYVKRTSGRAVKMLYEFNSGNYSKLTAIPLYLKG